MKIEEGKFYRTAGGYKVGPMEYSREQGYPWRSDGGLMLFDSIGRRMRSAWGTSREQWDIVAEWTEESAGPVRTVTRKEIVTGTYGKVMVGAPDNAWLPAIIKVDSSFNAEELTAAIETLTAVRDALGEAE